MFWRTFGLPISSRGINSAQHLAIIDYPHNIRKDDSTDSAKQVTILTLNTKIPSRNINARAQKINEISQFQSQPRKQKLVTIKHNYFIVL